MVRALLRDFGRVAGEQFKPGYPAKDVFLIHTGICSPLIDGLGVAVLLWAEMGLWSRQ
jgi:hypothetical protein